jgi:hypothetical protein
MMMMMMKNVDGNGNTSIGLLKTSVILNSIKISSGFDSCFGGK